MPPEAVLSPRFTVHRRLGSGGFGTVYDVHDRVRDARVALKKLTRLDAGTIYRFKREFRVLADVTHPNLVRLHELVSIGDDWYITMDLVEGVDFRTYVRGVTEDDLGIASTTVEGATGDVGADDVTGESPAAAGQTARSEAAGLIERLRGALGQLVAGVAALHQAGKLHRDLKPTNVLVTRAGRLVILDFGLVTNLAGTDESFTMGVRGTPAYMSPEQAAGENVTAASDWYSVGVMLYESLRGRLPFAGSVRDMIAAKRQREPADPRAERPGLPDDLCDLALALLRRAPDKRPEGSEIVARLGISVEAPNPAPHVQRESGPFVGRKRELEALREALARVRAREAPVVAHIHGTSGLGKTALVRQFLDELTARDEALILEARCYERESVPYKAFDGIVDALAGLVRRLPDSEASALMPRDSAALARLFPTFARLDASYSRAARPNLAGGHELRRRAFGALKEMLGKLARERPLVLFLDDLQWGDVDSAALLTDLLAPPDAPPLLLCACHRREDAATSGFLRALRQERARGAGGDVREIPLEPLDAEATRELAAELLPASAEEETVAAVARESGGNPLFVAELARAARGGRGAPVAVSLGEMLARRVAALPDGARAFLEVVALHGRPLEYEIARRAVGDFSGKDEQDAVAHLRSARLIRLSSAHERQVVETLNNRIRETVVAGLDETAAAALHGRLARALEAAPDADPEALAIHLLGAGDVAKARVHAERAGDRAADILAFDHAVRLYRMALGGPSDSAIKAKLAGALASAGRGAEAAATYLDAREGQPAAAAAALSRRAGEQLLRAGHVDEGLRVIGGALAAAGLGRPRGVGGTISRLVWRRLRLALRGMKFVERQESGVPAADLERIDLCWAIGHSLGGIDILQGAAWQARHLLLALAAGEPYRIARAMAWEAILSSLEAGPRMTRRAEDLAASAEQLAERIENPHALGWAVAAGAVTAWNAAEWRRASTMCEFATALFRERMSDVAWELGSLEIWFNLPALFFLGELGELVRRAPAALEDAQARGDRYVSVTLRAYITPLAHLVAGRPAAARDDIAAAAAEWGATGWHLQHWALLLGEGYVALAQGDGARALALLDERWPALKAAQQLRTQNIRVQARWLRGRAALAAGLPARAAADARALERERVPWAQALGRSLRAGVEPDRQRAAVLFAEAAEAFDGLSMALYAAASRRRQGEILQGDEGHALVATADAALGGAGAADVSAIAALLAPSAGV